MACVSVWYLAASGGVISWAHAVLSDWQANFALHSAWYWKEVKAQKAAKNCSLLLAKNSRPHQKNQELGLEIWGARVKGSFSGNSNNCILWEHPFLCVIPLLSLWNSIILPMALSWCKKLRGLNYYPRAPSELRTDADLKPKFFQVWVQFFFTYLLWLLSNPVQRASTSQEFSWSKQLERCKPYRLSVRTAYRLSFPVPAHPLGQHRWHTWHASR